MAVLGRSFELLQLKARDHDDDEVESLARLLRSAKDLGQARRAHAEVLENQKQSRSKYLANLVVDMYAGLGRVEEARAAFETIDRPNSFSWNILIKAYAQNGYASEAIAAYETMVGRAGPESATAYTYASVLGACSALEEARRVHARIREQRLESQVVVGSALVSMYARLGRLGDARRCFDAIEEPNAVSWTSMVAGYAVNGQVGEAKLLFNRSPEPRDSAVCNAMIDALSREGDLVEAKRIFDEMPEKDVVSETTMVSAFARSGHLAEARDLFELMKHRNVVSWNVMLAAYIQQGKMKEASSIFAKMPIKDPVSWSSMLAAYARRGAMEDARRIFDSMESRDIVCWNSLLSGYARSGDLEAAQQTFEAAPRKDTVTWNTMIAAYVVRGRLGDARLLFDRMPRRDAVTWNTMISCYACNELLGEAEALFNRMPGKNTVSWNAMILGFAEAGYCDEAIGLLRRMDLEGGRSDRITFVAIFDACAWMGALEDGRAIHGSLVDAGLFPNGELCHSIVNMYARCGSIEEAKSMFKSSPLGRVEAWNAMIEACSQSGLAEDALELFRGIGLEGLQPDDASFVRIISACSHGGMIDTARAHFVSICDDYHATATIDHYLCLADALGRAGRLDEAEEVIVDAMPFAPDAVAWMTLLSACKVHGDMDRALASAREVSLLAPSSSSAYVLLSNLYKQLSEALLTRSDADIYSLWQDIPSVAQNIPLA